MPVKVAVAESLAMDPVAVTVFAVPLLLNVSPLPAFAVKPQDPLPEPAGETVIVHNFTEVGPVTVMVVSVDANPAAVTVTVTPLGPDDGVSVRLATVPVNVTVAASLAAFPFAVTVFAVPPVLNVNLFAAFAVNVHDPLPPLAVMVHRVVDPIVTAMLVSVDANPAAVTVTVTLLGPDDGVSARLVTVPVNVVVCVSPAWLPVAVTTTVLPALLNVNPVVELATNVHGC